MAAFILRLVLADSVLCTGVHTGHAACVRASMQSKLWWSIGEISSTWCFALVLVASALARRQHLGSVRVTLSLLAQPFAGTRDVAERPKVA